VKIVEKAVEKLSIKHVEHVVEKIVEKPVYKTLENVVENMCVITKEKLVQVLVEKVVERIVEVPVLDGQQEVLEEKFRKLEAIHKTRTSEVEEWKAKYGSVQSQQSMRQSSSMTEMNEWKVKLNATSEENSQLRVMISDLKNKVTMLEKGGSVVDFEDMRKTVVFNEVKEKQGKHSYQDVVQKKSQYITGNRIIPSSYTKSELPVRTIYGKETNGNKLATSAYLEEEWKKTTTQLSSRETNKSIDMQFRKTISGESISVNSDQSSSIGGFDSLRKYSASKFQND